MCGDCWVHDDGKYTEFRCNMRGFSDETKRDLRSKGFEPMVERMARLIEKRATPNG